MAANLAIVMAQAGRRVALVDADLRRPVIHKVFNHRTQPGLTDLMLQQPDMAEWLTVLQPSAVENLTLITSGPLPPNPAPRTATSPNPPAARRG